MHKRLHGRAAAAIVEAMLSRSKSRSAIECSLGPSGRVTPQFGIVPQPESQQLLNGIFSGLLIAFKENHGQDKTRIS